MNEYIVNEPIILIDYLIEVMGKTHKQAKTLLTNEQVLVNGKVETKYNKPLLPGVIVKINSFNTKNMDSRIEIIYEDKDIIVVNKPSNMLTVASLNEKENTLYHLVGEYLKKKNKNAKVFIVHRLDKETSGLVLFAKSEKVKNIYQNNWDSIAINRSYIAIVNGKMDKKYGKVVQYLVEKDDYKVFAGKKGPDSKEAITLYKVIKDNGIYSLVDIEIKTGRKNQIRVAMQSLGNPILGDTKYGLKDKSFKKMYLLAYKLVINNPILKKEQVFNIPIPEEYYNIVKR